MTVYARLTGFNGEEIEILQLPFETSWPLWIDRPVMTAPLLVHLGYWDDGDDLSDVTFTTERYTHLWGGHYRRIR